MISWIEEDYHPVRVYHSDSKFEEIYACSRCRKLWFYIDSAEHCCNAQNIQLDENKKYKTLLC